MSKPQLTQDEIEQDVEEIEEGPEEGRQVSPSDDSDSDIDDTTPLEAEEEADWGAKVLEEERKRHEKDDSFDE